MTKVSELTGKRVFVHKRPKTNKKTGQVEERVSKLGRIHMAVFNHRGTRLVGFLVRRPDVAGVVKRDDVFLAWDSFAPVEKGYVVTRDDDGMDDAARKRLGIDWDSCILWAGMDARTESGKELGYVSDASFDMSTGRVECFYVGDGGISRALVGSLEIPPSMVVRYSKGNMILAEEAAHLAPDGGAAAKAGEGYAKAKVAGAAVGKKAAKAASEVGRAAGEAVDKGSYALGKGLGAAKRAIDEAMADDEPQPQLPEVAAEDVSVSDPAPRPKPAKGEPKTYRPTNASPKKSPKTPEPTAGDQAARAVGRQLGRMGKMFGSFKDEFDKASK